MMYLNSRPIRGQYSGHMMYLDQSEDSIQVTLCISTNQRTVFRSHDVSRPIRGQYSGHMMYLDQSEDSIQVTLCISTKQRTVFRSHDVFQPIRGQLKRNYKCMLGPKF